MSDLEHGADDSRTTADGSAEGASTPQQSDAGPTQRPKKKRSFWVELPILAVIAIVIALLLRTFLLETFVIPSGSMENTLMLQDKVLVNKVVYRTRDPRRGEVIVFAAPDSWREPGESKDFIKRAVAVGGDTVSCTRAGGKLIINGKPLTEPYLYPGSAPCLGAFDVTVPAHRLFVCGDHRDFSADSRRHLDYYHGTGTIAVSSVVGRAFVIVWPPHRWSNLPVPSVDNGIPAHPVSAGG